jgi:hypothetical protein
MLRRHRATDASASGRDGALSSILSEAPLRIFLPTR